MTPCLTALRKIARFSAVCTFLLALSPLAHAGTLPNTVDLNVTPGAESSPVLRIYGDDTNDQLGSDQKDGIAFGDIDADGLADLVIGVRIGGGSGEVYVLFGDQGLQGTQVDFNSAAGSNGEARILGDNPGDLAGNAVTSGDINGDGFDDVVIGARLADNGGRSDVGTVYIMYGNASMSGSQISLDSAPGTNGETRIYGDDQDDKHGNTLACGDINGDGFDDIILGAPENPAGTTEAGEVVIVYGSANLPATQIDLSQAVGSNSETRILGEDADNHTSWGVASGDINGDGYDDVILGAFNGDPAGRGNAGEAYVVYGGPSKPGVATGTGSVVDLNTGGVITAAGETRFLGDDNSDALGWSVGSADVNADGFDDVLLTAIHANPPGGVDGGEAYIVYGSSAKPGTASGAGSIVDLSAAAGTHGETRILGDDGSDEAGWAIAGSDVNGDGFEDVVTTAKFGDPAGGADAGEAYIVFGGASKPGTPTGAGSTVDLNSVNGDVEVHGDNANDLFASAAAGGGDLDGDGFADFVLATQVGDNPSIGGDNNSGYAIVLFGDGNAASATVTERNRAGASPKRGVGGRLSPVARTWLSFDAGDDGSGGASTEVVTVTRSDAGISSLGDGTNTDVANVVWEVTSNRTGFGSANVTFRYLDNEVLEFSEVGILLYQAPSMSGPWTQVSNQSLSTGSNSVTASVTGFSFFALMGDIVPPTISITGNNPETVECSGTYVDAGATASDAHDGDLTGNIVTASNVDTSTPGSYSVTYDVSDSSGNAAVQAVRVVNVVDTQVPTINILGSSPVTVQLSSVYTDAGAVAQDTCAGDLTADIVVTNPVNTSIAGTYLVAYDVNDGSGNMAQTSRMVIVADVPSPAITCEDFRGFVQTEWPLIQADLNLPGDSSPATPGRQIPERFGLGMVEAVLCNPNHQHYEATVSAYLFNLASLEAENEPLLSRITPYKHVLAALLLINQQRQDFLVGELSLLNTYVTVRGQGSKAIDEPYSDEGDLDGDGTSNADEYNNVIASGGGYYDFVIAVGNPNLVGAALPTVNIVFLSVLVGLLVGLGTFLLTSQATRKTQ